MKKKICLPISEIDLEKVDREASRLQISRAEMISRLVLFYFGGDKKP